MPDRLYDIMGAQARTCGTQMASEDEDVGRAAMQRLDQHTRYHTGKGR